MKLLLLSFICCLYLPQSLEVISLKPEETARLVQMMAKVTAAAAVEQEAWTAYCKVEQEIKTIRKLQETSGGCGMGGWSTEWTSSTGMTSGSSRWLFSKDYKFLVHQGNLQ